MNLKSNKAITLVALIITIIILLILAGVTLSMVLGDNGLINKAQSSVDKYQESATNEQTLLNSIEEYIDSKMNVVPMVEVGDIFDPTGTVEGKLHVGDFIGNYSAGNWDGTNGTEYKKLSNTGGTAPNNSTDKPSSNFQFGGFTSTASRDGNATPYNTSYAYVTDKATGQAVTGWRVFDVTDGKITLISAGCPEDYYHPYLSGGNYAYISEYILTGNINSSANASSLGLGTTYKPRDWSMYLSSAYKTTGTATVLTFDKLKAWYTKYMGVTLAYNDSTSFGAINGTKYESLIDNYSYYWLSSAGNPDYVFCVTPSNCYVTYYSYGAFGVRPLVTLPSSVKINPTSAGTKVVKSRDKEYTYNVWNIE